MGLDPLKCTNYLPGGLSLSQTDKSREVLCMCRGGELERDHVVYAGLRNGTVQSFDCKERQFVAECDVTQGKGRLVGVAKQER